MKATGKINITEGLKLNNPSLEIKSVTYNWITNKVEVEILFKEGPGVYKHSRIFEFDNKTGKELKTSDIYSYLSSHKTLKNFK